VAKNLLLLRTDAEQWPFSTEQTFDGVQKMRYAAVEGELSRPTKMASTSGSVGEHASNPTCSFSLDHGHHFARLLASIPPSKYPLNILDTPFLLPKSTITKCHTIADLFRHPA
jgi:hypothetical protein